MGVSPDVKHPSKKTYQLEPHLGGFFTISIEYMIGGCKRK